MQLDQEVRHGDRVSLSFDLGDGGPELRVMVELRHVRPGSRRGEAVWRTGGLFRTLSADDHARIARVVAGQLS
jgi:hypothetical protein